MSFWLLAALGFLLGYAGVRLLAYPRPPGPGPRRLSRLEHAFLAAAGDAVFPRGGPVPPSGTDAGIPAYVDRYVSAAAPTQRVLMRLLLVLIEQGTLLFPAPGWNGFRRFSALSTEQQVAALDGWRASRLFPRRLVFQSLRAILTMGYFGSPEVLRRLDLHPRAFPRPVLEADTLYPPVGRGPEAVRFGPADVTGPSPEWAPALDAPPHPDYAAAGEPPR